MLARIRKSMEEKDQGFTLIELLVVMIIIGILAAIAIPVFLNQRAKARDTAVKADVSTVGKEIATYYVDATGAPPALSLSGTRWVLTPPAPATVIDVGAASTGVAFGNQVGTNSSNWCVSLTHAEGDKKTFRYSAAAGLEQGACAAITP